MQTLDAGLKELMKQAVREVLEEQPKPAPAEDGPMVMSVQAAAKLAGVSAPTVYEWIDRPDCDFCLPVGRHYKILRYKLIAWLERQAASEKP